MSRRVVGLAAAGMAGVAAAALAFAGSRARARRRLESVAVESRADAHMWAIVAGGEPAEQVTD